MTDSEALKLALESGIIDIATVRQNLEMEQRRKILEGHPYQIYQGSDGKWRVYLQGRKLIKRNTKELVEDAIIAYYKEQETKVYIQDIFNEWIESKQRYAEISKATVDRYISDYNKYIKGTVLEEKPFKLIEDYELSDFIKTTIPKYKLTTKAYGNLKTLITGIFKYGKSIKQTDMSISQFFGDLQISKKVFARTVKEDKSEVFTDDEFELIENYIYEQGLSFVNLAILFTFYTGIRSGELAALTKNDVKGDYIEINKTEVHYKENGKEIYVVKDSPKTENGFRRVVLPDEAKKIITLMMLYHPEGDNLFWNEHGEVLHSYVCTHKLYRICAALKIPKRSMHKARKTYATKLINGNVDKKLIMKMMGHSDIKTTESYYYFDNATSENAKKQIKNAITY